MEECRSGAAGGYVMQLQNFSVNDGEGIRTNIFLAGCPLRCAWCCNPEGQTQHNDYVRYMRTEDVVRAVEKQLSFFRFSGGGVTFSGGEATAQAEFLRALAQRFYDMGISMALESCASFRFEEVEDILRKMDLIFMDIKHMNDAQHLRYTGVEVTPLLENIKKTYALRIPMVIRVPVILGVNATESNLKETFAFVHTNLPEAALELLPYHSFGADKYQKLRLMPPDAGFQTPTDAQLKDYAAWAEQLGVRVVSYK